MGSFRDLKAWHHAATLAIACTKAAATFPVEERFGLAHQLRRAAQGAALNIAEGSARRGPRGFRKFLEDARASLHEVEAILDLAEKMGYLTPEDACRLEQTRAEAARTVYGLLRAMTRRAEAG